MQEEEEEEEEDEEDVIEGLPFGGARGGGSEARSRSAIAIAGTRVT
jgi:hypothetical protein